MKTGMIKLNSINCWAGELGVIPSDDNNLPIMEESKSWASLSVEFYQQLSTEDKEALSKLINKDIE
jgi:hypothetical protein